jgi:glycosyltransferase involved in cell wall biosynthesis
MKVLWFTNTASLASSILNLPVIGGGWIESLEKSIRNIDDIELAVAFRHGEKELNNFNDGKAIYYAIPQRRKSKLAEVVDRHMHKLDDKDLIDYCIEIINEFKPDIINIFGTENGFGLISSRTRIPVVIHLQGILTIYEKKWFSPGITKWTLLRHTGVKFFLKGAGLFHDYMNFKKASLREQEIFRINKYFLGRTDWDRRITSILSPSAKYYLSNEILRSEFYSSQWTIKQRDTKVFISTIQGNIYKGLETVFECAKHLADLKKINFKWIIAGISKEDIVVKIFQKVIDKKVEEYNIVLNGKTSSKDLIALELDADIFIHPSHIDNSPNSVCEAMLLGMPVIATYTGGTGSLLIDGKEGLLIQDGDSHSMAGAILELVNQPEYAAGLGRNARLKAVTRHKQDDIVSNLMNIYTDVVETKALE